MATTEVARHHAAQNMEYRVQYTVPTFRVYDPVPGTDAWYLCRTASSCELPVRWLHAVPGTRYLGYLPIHSMHDASNFIHMESRFRRPLGLRLMPAPFPLDHYFGSLGFTQLPISVVCRSPNSSIFTFSSSQRMKPSDVV
jgi:hypothetical protein